MVLWERLRHIFLSPFVLQGMILGSLGVTGSSAVAGSIRLRRSHMDDSSLCPANCPAGISFKILPAPFKNRNNPRLGLQLVAVSRFVRVAEKPL